MRVRISTHAPQLGKAVQRWQTRTYTSFQPAKVQQIIQVRKYFSAFPANKDAHTAAAQRQKLSHRHDNE